MPASNPHVIAAIGDLGDLSDRLFLTIGRRSEAAESLLRTLCHLAALRELELFAVGGLIRDLLLEASAVGGAAPGIHQDVDLDIDLTVDGDPAPLHAALAEATGARPTVHDRFGTASATLADGARVDLARSRSERYPSPAALPVVAPAPIEVDLGRRDFTINAAALGLSGERAGALIDPHGAASDVRGRVVRTLHEDSFRDDPTRLIRAARYAARIGGTIERRTLAEARRHRGHLVALTPGRFGDAWRLLLQEPDAAAALALARRLRIPQSREPRWMVPMSALPVVSTVRACDGPPQFWAAMGLLGRDPQIVDWLPQSVGVNRRERAALEAGGGLRRARRSIGNMKRPSSVARALGRYPDSALQAAASVWSGASGAAVASYLQRRSEVESPIAARRLIELGVQPGPALGGWLQTIEAAIWDGQLDAADPSSVARMEQRIRWSR